MWAHGINRVTIRYIGKLAWTFATSLLFLAYLVLFATVDHHNMSWLWIGVLGIAVADKIWTVRQRGVRSTTLAGLMIPELAYDLFQQVVLFAAGWKFLTRAPQVW